jgi:hypothetical protein
LQFHETNPSAARVGVFLGERRPPFVSPLNLNISSADLAHIRR